MDILNRSISKAKDRPVKILQYGEGNFLRGFVDYMIDVANEKEVMSGSVVIVKAIEYGSLDSFYQQECQYTLSLRGIENGEAKAVNRIITSIADAVGAYEEYEKYAAYAKSDTLRFIVSNTTEAGIVFDETDIFEAKPPKTYPGKLTKFLFERYQHYNGNPEKGLIIIPCELIENNGGMLKQCVMRFAKLWNLEPGFQQWIENSCIFSSTLVDRIVTGYPKEEAEAIYRQLGYYDALLDTAELFGLWVIESEKSISDELPLDKAGLPVIFTDDQKPYRERKVRILNGAHTSFVLASFLAGNNYVLESMQDKDIRNFMTRTIFEEIIPTLSLPKEELVSFANSVIERFENPYIKHALLSISLNSVSKWRSRCLPSFKEYVKRYGKLPKNLTFSLAALLCFYKSREYDNGTLTGYRGEQSYTILDDRYVLEYFANASILPNDEYVRSFICTDRFFGEDLSGYEGLADLVTEYINQIEKHGMRKAIKLI